MIKNRKKRLWLGITINFLIIIIMFIVLYVYSSVESKNDKKQRTRIIEQATASITDTLRLYFDNQHKTIISIKDYCEKNSYTFDMTIDFIAFNTMSSSFRLVNCETYAASKRIDGKIEAVDLLPTKYEAMNAVYNDVISGEIDDSLINVSSSFTSPLTGEQLIAFYTDINIADRPNEKYALIGIVDISTLVGSGLPLPPYKDSGAAIIGADGNYILNNSFFKSVNIFEFFRSYNSLGYSDAEQIKHEVSANDSGTYNFLNAKGEPCVYAYEKIQGTDNLTYFCSVPEASYEEESMDYIFFILFLTFISLLLITDVLLARTFYTNINRSLELETLARETAENASRAKSDFLSRMSHEIRTPLNAIIGYNSIARNTIAINGEKKSFMQTTGKISSCLTKSDIASRHLLSVINDVLDMSSIESGKMKIVSENFDFRELILSLTTIFYSVAQNKDVRLSVIFESLTDEILVGDRMRVNQVLTNLLSNAIKFTPEGGRVSLSICQSEINDNEISMRFAVLDTGIGMEKSALDNIWTPFEQADISISRRFGGTGLGLTITKNLVGMMNGTISVNSEIDKGSEFVVRINFKRPETPDNPTPYDFSSIRALIADGEDGSCEHMETMLRRCGVRCKSVNSGTAAVEAIKKAREENDEFTICFMDWKMQDLSGAETVRLIRKHAPPGLPLIIVTAYDYTDIEDEAQSCGVKKFISKPVFQSAIFDILVNIAGKNSASDDKPLADSDFEGIRIILAEDNKMNMEIAYELLTDTGFKIDKAWNGKEALDLFCAAPKGSYSAILMDIQMPVMDGHRATEQIRSSGCPDAATIPIIAMTADAFVENISDAFAAGMTDHIAKPIDIRQLLDTIRKHILK